MKSFVFAILMMVTATTQAELVIDYMRYLNGGKEVFSDDPENFYYELHGDPLQEVVYGSLWTNAEPSAATVLSNTNGSAFLAWLANHPDNATIELHKAKQAQNDLIISLWRSGWLSTNVFVMSPLLEVEIYEKLKADTYAALRTSDPSDDLAINIRRSFVTDAKTELVLRYSIQPDTASYQTGINTNWVKLPSTRR